MKLEYYHHSMLGYAYNGHLTMLYSCTWMRLGLIAKILGCLQRLRRVGDERCVVSSGVVGKTVERVSVYHHV